MSRDIIELSRETALAAVRALAETRRKLRELSEQCDTASADARSVLASIEAPFIEKIEPLAETEEELKAIASAAISDFAEQRRSVLLSGVECPDLALPAGVSINWLDRPEVKLDELPDKYAPRVADMKAIKAALKCRVLVPGVTVVRVPSVVVKEEVTP